MYTRPRRSTAWLGGLAAAILLILAACSGAGGGSSPSASAGVGGAAAPGFVTQGGTLNIDFATYNPLSLIIKDQRWLEAELADQGVTVNWVQSAGSNKANEALRAGAIDVGSTAGSAALLARSNGSPIQVIDIYSQPEWAALVVPAGSSIASVADLKGKRIAATKGTDPYFFLLQSLQEAGIAQTDVTVEILQHADGWAALQNGSVDAWAGLDPIMAGAEKAGAKLLYRNVGFNSYGFLNATESFLTEKPDVAQAVVDAYEHARAWAVEHPRGNGPDPRGRGRARSRRRIEGHRRAVEPRRGSGTGPGAGRRPDAHRADLRRVRRRLEPGTDRHGACDPHQPDVHRPG